MTRTRPIRQVDHHPEWDGPGGGWTILFDREDGVPWCYAFPVATLWHRSAEYGIDVADAATLLDVVLHEMALTSVGQVLTGQEPDFVYHVAESVARAGHLERTARAKAQFAHPDPDNLLSKVTDYHLSMLSDPGLQDLHRKTRQTAQSIRRQRGAIKELTHG
jgi:hypothetical protein